MQDSKARKRPKHTTRKESLAVKTYVPGTRIGQYEVAGHPRYRANL
jgi:hypothetical protein